MLIGRGETELHTWKKAASQRVLLCNLCASRRVQGEDDVVGGAGVDRKGPEVSAVSETLVEG